MTPLEAAWESALGAPDDDQALHVLADALMEQGDAQGELIRLQLAGDEPAALQHLASHASELLGDARHLTTWTPLFARGFLSAVRVSTIDELEAIFDRPVGRLLREVRIIGDEHLEPIEPIVELLATRSPRTLTVLRFGAKGASATYPGEIDVDRLTSGMPSLQDLRVTQWSANLERATSPSLLRLRLNLWNPLRGLGEARFPALQSLGLTLPYRPVELPVSLLAGKVAPRLEALTLQGALWPEQLHQLAVSALLPGLKRLEISAEAETAWYAALLESIESFAHLERLDVIADRHHPEWVTAVKAALPRANILEARLRL